jgi:hypothetical protein
MLATSSRIRSLPVAHGALAGAVLFLAGTGCTTPTTPAGTLATYNWRDGLPPAVAQRAPADEAARLDSMCVVYGPDGDGQVRARYRWFLDGEDAYLLSGDVIVARPAPGMTVTTRLTRPPANIGSGRVLQQAGGTLVYEGRRGIQRADGDLQWSMTPDNQIRSPGC